MKLGVTVNTEALEPPKPLEFPMEFTYVVGFPGGAWLQISYWLPSPTHPEWPRVWRCV